MTHGRSRKARLPSKQDLKKYLSSQPEGLRRSQVARDFGLKGADRRSLYTMLRELEDEGLVAAAGGGAARDLPPVLILEVVGLDEDGEVLAKPVKTEWAETAPLLLRNSKRLRPAARLGDRVLARLLTGPDGTNLAEVIRVLPSGPRRFLAVVEDSQDGLRLHPVDKRLQQRPIVQGRDAGGAKPGELVQAEVLGNSRRGGRAQRGNDRARVVARCGRLDPARSFSLIAIQEHGIPFGFDPDCMAEAEAAGPVDAHQRMDLRHLAFVTIDGSDARDFDDAVWAEPDSENPGGWHLMVAIADVAHYVKPGSHLDQSAAERGNSVYFPDQVVPMLPEALSNGWCSLKPEEDRGTLVAELWIDATGNKRKHRFHRAVIRSAARLTYEAVQAAHDSAESDIPQPLVDGAIKPLFGAFAALLQARKARGSLELSLEEREVHLAKDGRVEDIRIRPQLESHRLIEEFMIAANVAAAETLESQRHPTLFRVHDRPDPEKLDGLRRALESFELSFPRGQVVRPESFNRLLAKVKDPDQAAAINELVLRCQCQAIYSPKNIGHFGLGLRRYCHFTSPIRRYADLMVHRALIEALGLGTDKLEKGKTPRPIDKDRAAAGDLAAAGEHLSMTERRATAAERDTVDRYAAAYLGNLGPGPHAGRIAGISRAGLFVRMLESGVDGLLPFSGLPDDRYDIDSQGQKVVGRRWGKVFSVGSSIAVRLQETDPLSGKILLGLAAGADRPHGSRVRSTKPSRRK